MRSGLVVALNVVCAAWSAAAQRATTRGPVRVVGNVRDPKGWASAAGIAHGRKPVITGTYPGEFAVSKQMPDTLLFIAGLGRANVLRQNGALNGVTLPMSASAALK